MKRSGRTRPGPGPRRWKPGNIAWGDDEAVSRLDMMPEKTEMVDGKLYWTEQDRLVVLGLLLENVGVDRANRLGDPQIWREAIAALDGDQRASGQ